MSRSISHGNPVVTDLDGFAVGPGERDLALTAIYYDSFGWHSREENEDSCACTTLTSWPGPATRS